MDPSLDPQFEQNRLPAEFASPQFEHVTSSMAVGGGIGGTNAPPEGGGGSREDRSGRGGTRTPTGVRRWPARTVAGSRRFVAGVLDDLGRIAPEGAGRPAPPVTGFEPRAAPSPTRPGTSSQRCTDGARRPDDHRDPHNACRRERHDAELLQQDRAAEAGGRTTCEPLQGRPDSSEPPEPG